MKIEEKKSITPRDNPSTEINEEHILEEDLEKAIDNESKEEYNKKGRKGKTQKENKKKKQATKTKKEKKLETQQTKSRT